MQFIISLVKSGKTDPNIHDHALYSQKISDTLFLIFHALLFPYLLCHT